MFIYEELPGICMGNDGTQPYEAPELVRYGDLEAVTMGGHGSFVDMSGENSMQ